jgi:5,10-methylenetetrahydrofolate reductase
MKSCGASMPRCVRAPNTSSRSRLPIFDLDLLGAFLERTAHHKVPVIAGIWPLTSFRNAEFMVNELRVPVPAAYMERMRGADSAEGVAIAREMVEQVRPLVAGVQLSAPFGRYQLAIEVADAIGPRVPC